MKRTAFAVMLASLLLAERAEAQVFVAPTKAFQSKVRYFDFDWMHVDILVGQKIAAPEPTWTSTAAGADATTVTSTRTHRERIGAGIPRAQLAETATVGVETSTRTAAIQVPFERPRRSARSPSLSAAGGMRLYFYRQEDVIAGRAAGSIEDTYYEYIREFGYVPKDLFPYVLYSSYQEFLQTNLFPVQEGILGVTSTTDLKLALPFFGDFQLFREVSRHEMAHQFTIQKAREAAESIEGRSGLEALPLWLIEGLAEYYAKRGVDDEAELFALDLVLNTNVERGYGMLGFFEDRPGSGLWTYKIGQVRVKFLEDTYGRGTIQRILEASPLLTGDVGGLQRIEDFPSFLAALVGEEPTVISSKFSSWLKHRMLPAYLRARQSPADVRPLFGLADYIDAINTSPSGHLVMFRSIDLETGQSELSIVDHRAPEDSVRIVVDGVPGAESLHPVGGRNFDASDRELVYVAQAGGADVLYKREIEHRASRIELGGRGDPRRRDVQDDPPKPVPSWSLPGLSRKDLWDVELGLGKKTAYHVGERGIVAVYSPSFSPDGARIGFIGLDMRGQRDIYILDGDEDDYRLTRVTHDDYAERTLAWGPAGLVYTSDRTSHGNHNLFRVRPEEASPIVSLLDEPREHLSPQVLPDGRVFFVAYADARANVYELLPDGRVLQRTDFPTGAFDISPGPDGGIWTLLHHAGERHVVRMEREKLLSLPVTGELAGDDAGEPSGASGAGEAALAAAESYRPYAIENWQLDSLFALAGIGGGSVFGTVYAATSDRLRNHALILQLTAYGSFDLTDGRLVYINEEGRVTWGFGPFQALQYRNDETLAETVGSFTSYERFYGGFGVLRYPFNRFFYVQGDLALGGTSFALDSYWRDQLRNFPRPGTEAGNALDYWDRVNGGVRFQSRASLSFGYDTIRYHRATGPLDGTSVLLEGSVTAQPFDDEVYGLLQLDVQRYFQVIGRVNFFVRGGAGTSVGGQLARKFFLYSFDTIRGVEFRDQQYLLGRNYVYGTAELQIPLNWILAFAFLTDIEGIAGFDFGGVADDLDHLFDRRVLNGVLGINFGLGLLVLRLHFAHPIDIGGNVPAEDRDRFYDWVTNFSLGWNYF